MINVTAYDNDQLMQPPSSIGPGAPTSSANGGFLPEIRGGGGNQTSSLVRANSKSSMRTQHTVATDLSHFKKASA
jgi:hypothetical protein